MTPVPPFPPPPMPAQPGKPAAAPSAKQTAAATWKAARDFEAMALGQLLQPMFQTLDAKGGPFGGGQAEETWRPMLVDEMAKKIAAAGGLGLAAPVYAQMLRAQESAQRPGTKEPTR